MKRHSRLKLVIQSQATMASGTAHKRQPYRNPCDVQKAEKAITKRSRVRELRERTDENKLGAVWDTEYCQNNLRIADVIGPYMKMKC